MNPVGYLETSVLYCGDNLHRLTQFPSECIDLIYLDPPFFSNKNYDASNAFFQGNLGSCGYYVCIRREAC